MLEYKPQEELIALIKRYEQELSAERAEVAKLRTTVAGVQSRMGGLIKEGAEAAPCKPTQPVARELPPLHIAAQNVVAQFCDPHVSLASVARYVNELGDVLAAQPVRQPAAVVGQEPIGYAPTYLTERLDAGDSGVMLTVTRKPLPGHGVTVALYTAPVPAAGVQGCTGCDPAEGFCAECRLKERAELSGNIVFCTSPSDAMKPEVGDRRYLAINTRAQPDSGRDAALLRNTISNAIYGYGAILEDHVGVVYAIAEALAAHPAPSSDAAARQDLGLAKLVIEEKIRIIEQANARIAELEAAHPANGAQAGLSEAARDVLSERSRQMVSEGFSSARDDSYTNNELAHAAATYAYPALHSVKGLKVWPWGDTWLKVRDHRRNMVKAGALILAEIERLDRAAPQKKEG